jgi:hypothetical protein
MWQVRLGAQYPRHRVCAATAEAASVAMLLRFGVHHSKHIATAGAPTVDVIPLRW